MLAFISPNNVTHDTSQAGRHIHLLPAGLTLHCMESNTPQKPLCSCRITNHAMPLLTLVAVHRSKGLSRDLAFRSIGAHIELHCRLELGTINLHTQNGCSGSSNELTYLHFPARIVDNSMLSLCNEKDRSVCNKQANLSDCEQTC